MIVGGYRSGPSIKYIITEIRLVIGQQPAKGLNRSRGRDGFDGGMADS
jgi:hypothetical protein